MPINFSFDHNFNELPPLADACDHKSAIKLTSYMQNDKRRVSMPPKDCSAVEVRRLRYVVGSRRKAKVILSGINMTVPEGAIYGLLGPSGSGKTTLLKSVVGQLTPSEGWVKVFGFQPNQPGSQIPGSAIGYMPQELAVYEDFTIKETLWYFGRLYRIPNRIIKERIEFLLTFLDLPRSQRLIVNMSGGQKRRVSLASALVHSPPLLILDEPTVGVDPLLRQSIWQHLVTLTQTEKITVIVTTHYIEEARRANIVGLMRRGRLLAENAPEDLMAKHKSSSLEDVFLKLCVTDTMRRAQKFASLAGIPMQVAITGSSGSALPTPQIRTKRHHTASIELKSNGCKANNAPALQQECKLASSDGSQSPDEGLQTTSAATSLVSSSSSSSSSLENQQQEASAASSLEDQRSAPMAHNDTEQEKKVASETQELQVAPGKGCLKQAQPVAAQKRRFQQLKSLLKLGVARNAPPEGATYAAASAAAAEKRRQSGTHFIEQLMSRYQAEQGQAEAGAAPVDQLLSCDTEAPKQQQQQQQVARLDVPKISVHSAPKGSLFGGDSGASSNGSSQNHSPVAAYVNQSYQASECGSTAFNDLALVSASGVKSAARSNRDLGQDELDVVVQTTAPVDEDDDPELFLNPAHLSTMSPGGKYDYKKQSLAEYCDTIGTITWKNYIRLKRNVPLLLFQFVLPAIQVILFCICVGNDPFDIPVAVVNEESAADTSIIALSTQFLHSIDGHLVRQVVFNDLAQAIESVRRGENWGVIHIPENFTLSVHKRFTGMEAELDDATLENSTIKVYPDMTNQPIGHAMDVAFRRAYSDLTKQTFEFLGLNAALSNPPIRMQEAIYGKLDMQNYLQYMSPGVLISISYIMATGLTSLAFIIERRDGLYDRTLAAGVGHVQMLLSHSIVQLVVMIVQISLVVFFTFVIYKVPTKGPFVWVFILLLLQGLAGMSFGLMVSAICKEENTAIMMILGTFYPNLLLAGVIWPIEAIPHWLRWFSYLQPQTLPTQSLRDLIVRGWDIDQKGVWSGFVVTSVWLVLFLAISCLSFKIKK